MSLRMCDFVVSSSFHNQTAYHNQTALCSFREQRLLCANDTTRVIFTLFFFPYSPLLYEPTSILRQFFHGLYLHMVSSRCNTYIYLSYSQST